MKWLRGNWGFCGIPSRAGQDMDCGSELYIGYQIRDA